MGSQDGGSGAIMGKFEWACFILACSAGLAYQVFILYGEITAASVPIISYEFDNIDVPPAITLCLKWPTFVYKRRALPFFDKRLKTFPIKEPKNQVEMIRYQLTKPCIDRVEAGLSQNLTFEESFKGKQIFLE